jgi:hypothetical protein
VPLANLPRLAVGAYLGRKRWGVPDFLYAALDTTAYAAFFKESRMKRAGAINLLRKSGGSPTIAFAESPQIWFWIAEAFNHMYPLLLSPVLKSLPCLSRRAVEAKPNGHG